MIVLPPVEPLSWNRSTDPLLLCPCIHRFWPRTDKKCPWTGLVSIRGRILTGKVVSTKMTRTIIIRREYLHFVPKYSRYEKRHKNVAAHVSPAFRVQVGDTVTIGQCRPLSKTVRFNVLKVAKNKSAEKAAKQFGRF